MKSILSALVSVSLLFQSILFIPITANASIAIKPTIPVRQLQNLRQTWQRSPTISIFVRQIETLFGIDQSQSFKTFLNLSHRNQYVSFRLFGKNKIVFEQSGRQLTLDITNDDQIRINQRTLTEAELSNPELLLNTIQNLMTKTKAQAPTSFLQWFFQQTIQEAHADLGWIGFGAIVIAAGLIAFGIHKATKNLSNTKHEIVVKAPTEYKIDHKIDTNINTNIKAQVEATGNLNGNLNAQGLPSSINLNLNLPGGVK